MAVRRLPPFMNQDTMATITPSRSKEWRDYNIWPPDNLRRDRLKEKDENWEMVKSGVFTQGEAYADTVDLLYNHETRITEIDKFLVKQRMKEERCHFREQKLIQREKDRIERANAIVHRKKKIKEENITRDAILKSYAKFKQEAQVESDSLEEFAHDHAVLDEMRQRRQFNHMDADMATLLTDVALGSGSITLAKSIRTEIANTELIRSELAETLREAQNKNYHRSQLPHALERAFHRRLSRHIGSNGKWHWGGPRGSSPRRASLEFRAAKLFQTKWRGFAARSVEHRAVTVLSIVDERSQDGSQVFAATAMRMVAEKNKETEKHSSLEGGLEENARHIRLLYHNLIKFRASSKRLAIVESDWKQRAARSRELSKQAASDRVLSPDRLPSRLQRRRSSMSRQQSLPLEPETGEVEEVLLEEGMALHKERAIVDAAIQYTAASMIQRFARMVQVSQGTLPMVVSKHHDAHADVRRNQSRQRVEHLWDIREAKRNKAMIIGFTMFQQKVRHFLINSVVERSSKATIGRMVIRHKYAKKGAKILDGIRQQRREALCNAVFTTVFTVRSRLLRILNVWHEWAEEQGERRAWLQQRDRRRRALIIEEMLYNRLLLKRKLRTEVLRDMGGSMTKVLTKYKQSKWDWCSLLTVLDEEMHRVDPNGTIAKRILLKPTKVDKDKLRRLQGHRSPEVPHKALLYLLNESSLFKRVPVPPRKNAKQFVPNTSAPAHLFPEIVPTSPRQSKPSEFVSPSGRYAIHPVDSKSNTWNNLISSELMFASTLLKKKEDSPAKKQGMFNFKVGRGEAELEATRLEARKDDAHVHRHLTIPVWYFLKACGDYFQKCSANAVSRDESVGIAEEREMLDDFLGKFLEVRQEDMPYLQTDKLKKSSMQNTSAFYRWMQECDYCPTCFALAAHPTGEGKGVTDWSDPSNPKPPKRKCPSCGYRFISRHRADTGLVATRLRSQAGVASQDINCVQDVNEPIASLMLHAAVAVLAPVGSWQRAKGLKDVWRQAVELAKPIIERARIRDINTIADFSCRKSEAHSLISSPLKVVTDEDRVIDKALSFLKILDELIIRRRQERKEADLSSILDRFQREDERSRRALLTRQTIMHTAQTQRFAMSERLGTGYRTVKFENELSEGVTHEPTPRKSLRSRQSLVSRESKKSSRGTSVFGDFPSAPPTPIPIIVSKSKHISQEKKPIVSNRKPQPGASFAGAEYRIRPLRREKIQNY